MATRPGSNTSATTLPAPCVAGPGSPTMKNSKAVLVVVILLVFAAVSFRMYGQSVGT